MRINGKNLGGLVSGHTSRPSSAGVLAYTNGFDPIGWAMFHGKRVRFFGIFHVLWSLLAGSLALIVKLFQAGFGLGNRLFNIIVPRPLSQSALFGTIVVGITYFFTLWAPANLAWGNVNWQDYLMMAYGDHSTNVDVFSPSLNEVHVLSGQNVKMTGFDLPSDTQVIIILPPSSADTAVKMQYRATVTQYVNRLNTYTHVLYRIFRSGQAATSQRVVNQLIYNSVPMECNGCGTSFSTVIVRDQKVVDVIDSSYPPRFPYGHGSTLVDWFTWGPSNPLTRTPTLTWAPR